MKSLWRNKAQSDRAGVAEFKTLVTLARSYNQQRVLVSAQLCKSRIKSGPIINSGI